VLELLLGVVTAEKVGFPTITPKSSLNSKPEALESIASDPADDDDDDDDEIE
jgi:hypothetical protein